MPKDFIVDEIQRLDKFLTTKLNQNRNQVVQLIKKGYITIEGKKNIKSSLKLQLNQIVKVELPKVKKTKALEVDFDIEVIYEDDYILVINKPSGVIVHDAPSVKVATLVDWLKKYGISLSTISGEQRHGIVHRLDKGTSGVLVVAKTNEAHVALSKQLENKTMGRYYLAIIDLPLKDDIIIETNISRDPNNRLKMGNTKNGKYAKTAFKKLSLSTNDNYELISAKLFTGRTHQIRVHLGSINRHILGDTLYGFKPKNSNIPRVFLHAYCLYLVHPITNKNMEFVANMPSDMVTFTQNNFDKDILNEQLTKEYISNCFCDIDCWL